ncbi:UNVERIFIED_CONTAM: ATP-binding cassette sub-family F member 2 [Trichonephila clavipes]
MAKMVAGGLTEKVATDKVVQFYFLDCGTIPPPVIMVQNVSFRYTDDGLAPSDGLVRTNSHLKFGRYHQHLTDLLNLDISALEYMMTSFPEVKEKEEMRKIIGRFGLTGRQQVCPIRQLSDGQRCRVVFAWLAWQSPHLLLLDEPTNHLDMETIDALAEAINEFSGGMVLVSHDFRLISQVAQEIWICEKQTVTKWSGTIQSYKDHLRKRILKNLENPL